MHAQLQKAFILPDAPKCCEMPYKSCQAINNSIDAATPPARAILVLQDELQAQEQALRKIETRLASNLSVQSHDNIMQAQWECLVQVCKTTRGMHDDAIA